MLSSIMVTRSCYIIIFLILSSNCQNSNMTSVLDMVDEHRTTTKYVAVVFITAFLLYGIVSNLLMAITFCGRDNIYSPAFILISIQLIISSFGLFLPEIAIVLPELLRNNNISEAHQTTWETHISSFLKPFSLLSTLHFTFLLTLNRFITQISPKYNSFFESVKLYFLLSFVWLFRQTWTLFLPIAMFVMYIAIFYSIRRKRLSVSDINQIQENSRMHASIIANTGGHERIMLIQAAIICGALESTILVFNFLPLLVLKIFGQKAIIPLGIFINCYGISSRAALPTVYFIYNKQARNIVKNFFLRLRLLIAIRKATTATSTNIAVS
uniref:G-protein coupled receptors family 1 profile domain-containing protein n=1 Tax=Onchocerca volvulus TaxID=6282 RepID=A0A2K6WMK5_ONCVO